MNTSFINEYVALPTYIAPSNILGVGTYRIYLNASSPLFIASSHGINKVIAIDCISQSIFTAIQDKLVEYGGSIILNAGNSVNSQYLINNTIPSGKMLLGNYTNIKLI